MATSKPHYLLFCDGCLLPSGALHTEARGRWRFVLEDIVTGTKTEASDCESSDHVDRVSLLAVTRGLEALEQPSRVTLVTTSRYVARGLQYGLIEWRENDYCWEHFGSIQPIRNADLWRRVDVALRFHEVQCRWMSQECPSGDEPSTAAVVASEVTREPASPPTHIAMEGNFGMTDSRENEIPVPNALGATVAFSDLVQPAPLVVCDTATQEHEVNSLHSMCVASTSSPTSAAQGPIEPTASVAFPGGNPPGSQPPTPHRRLLNMKAAKPIRWIWKTILALDAFLVSCLRCLFLLDPRSEHFRRRNY